MGGILQGATELKRSSKLHRSPELGWERGGSGEDGTGRSGNSNAQDEKGKATGADEVRLTMMGMAGEVRVKWTGRLLHVCMQEEGEIPKEWRMVLIVLIWQRKKGMCMAQESSGAALYSAKYLNCWRGTQ